MSPFGFLSLCGILILHLLCFCCVRRSNEPSRVVRRSVDGSCRRAAASAARLDANVALHRHAGGCGRLRFGVEAVAGGEVFRATVRSLFRGGFLKAQKTPVAVLSHFFALHLPAASRAVFAAPGDAIGYVVFRAAPLAALRDVSYRPSDDVITNVHASPPVYVTQAVKVAAASQ